MKHGTPSGYIYWKCRCVECRAANAKKSAVFTETRPRYVDPVTGRVYAPGAPHGTRGGYSNHGCRCEECSEAFNGPVSR